MRNTVPLTDVKIGTIVTAEFKKFGGDVCRSGHVVGIDPVQVYFGPWTGTITFSPGGWQRASGRWGARIVDIDQSQSTSMPVRSK